MPRMGHTVRGVIGGAGTQLSTLLQRAPRTLALLGIGVVNAARVLVAAGENIDRLPSEAAIAHLCGVAPIPASSGKIERHRLNPGGNRDANCTLHKITVVRLRFPTHPRLRHPPHRRWQVQEGDHPLRQTLHRPRGLLHPPRRLKRSCPGPLTNIGTSRVVVHVGENGADEADHGGVVGWLGSARRRWLVDGSWHPWER
jgi:hypothetical protein